MGKIKKQQHLGGGGVGATPKEMARAKHMLVNNKEEKARERAQMAEKMKHSVILDVGGDRFLALKSTLLRHPTTRLGRLMMATTVDKILQLCDEFLPGNPPEYFFDRNPVNFPTILNMYRWPEENLSSKNYLFTAGQTNFT